MMKLNNGCLVIMIVFCLFSCHKSTDSNQTAAILTLTIDSVLNGSGTKSLQKDNNGFYQLVLDRNNRQTFSRVTGHVLLNGKEPLPPEKVNWESNLYWWLRPGDIIATITKTYINYYTGQYTIVSLPPLVANKNELVPTVNCCSYSGTGGETNTVIAPTYDMIGDTLFVKCTMSNDSFHIAGIILK